MTCPYCNQTARLTTGATIYPHRPDLHALRFWACVACDAYVGCHRGTERPLGRLANLELRQAKMRAHAAFDPLWRARDRSQRPKTRSEAYAWLARQLGIERERCHIGEMDVEMCERVVEVCRTRKASC